VTYPYSGLQSNTLPELLQALDLSSAPGSTHSAVSQLLTSLDTIFRESEALVLSVSFALTPDGSLQLYDPDFMLDDAAFRSNGRVASLHTDESAASSPPDPREVEAGKDGIVYIPLTHEPTTAAPPAPSATENIAVHQVVPGDIGTLVNGAGLAMNTLDALQAIPAHPFNFLDTGGKATAATIKTCFSLLLREPTVSVVFVNIFGGLTRCDMIAEGILQAYEELGAQMEEKGVRVVVRLRGTNEAEGQQIVAKSGLPVKAFDGFEEAVAEVVRLTEMAALEGRRRERLARGE
jgi:succinyl-CoA synthetase alpha subunit